MCRAIDGSGFDDTIEVRWKILDDGRPASQENPFANSFAYGIASLHRFVTMTGHVYQARGIWANRAMADAWPADLRDVMGDDARQAITSQRVDAAELEASYRRSR